MTRQSTRRERVESALDSATRAARSFRTLDAEVFVLSSRVKSLAVEQDTVRSATSTDADFMFVRAVRDKRMGVSFTNLLDAKSIRRCIGSARKLTSLTDRDPDWNGFPSAPKRYPIVKGTCDRALVDVELSTLGAKADEMVQAAQEEAVGVTVTDGSVDVTERTVGVSNTEGLSAVTGETYIGVMCSSVSGRGGSVSPDCPYGMYSTSLDIDFEHIGSESGRIAMCCAVTAEPSTEDCEAVFSPVALGSDEAGLFCNILRGALSGESAVRKNTLFVDRVGDRVASKAITITDNPIAPSRAGSRPFDDEGMATQRTELIKDGVLKGFLWDSYHASLAGKKSTGSAVRNMSTGSVSTGPLFLHLKPGTKSLDELVREVDRGYLVWSCQGAHTSSPETGMFSFVASPGLLIEKGHIVGCVRGAMISGNIADLMSNAEKVGSDLTDFGSTLMPSVLFTGVRVTTG